MELGAIYTQATKGERIANFDQVHQIVGEPLLDVPFNRFGTIPCIFRRQLEIENGSKWHGGVFL